MNKKTNLKSKNAKRIIVLVILMAVLVPVGVMGFKYFFDNQIDETGVSTLSVKGDIEVDKLFECEGLVPGDVLCNAINFKIDSTAPSLLRVKVSPYYKDSESSSDKNYKQSIVNISYFEEDKWLKGDDGYYYYKQVVKSDNNSDNIIKFINDIRFELSSDEEANEYQNKYIGVDLNMEMVQAKYDGYKTKWSISNEGEVYNLLNNLSNSVTE